jgi:membrane protein
VSWWKHVKAMLLIGFTVFLVLAVFSVQPVMTLGLKLVNHNVVVNAVYANLESLRCVIDGFRALEMDSFSFFRSTFTQALLFWVYFALVYRWFFNWRLKKREAFLASGTFVTLLLLGKTIFGFYFNYLRVRLVASYGDFYTLLVGAMWIYLLMAFFFFWDCFGGASY